MCNAHQIHSVHYFNFVEPTLIYNRNLILELYFPTILPALYARINKPCNEAI